MACELFTREFKKSDGSEVTVAVRQLAASKALSLHIDLIGKLGNGVFPLIDDKYNFADVINIMRSNESTVVADLIKSTVCTAAMNGNEIKPATFDLLFNGELMLIVQIFAFVLEANFKTFFKQGLEMNELRRLEAVTQSKLEEQKLAEQTSQQSSLK